MYWKDEGYLLSKNNFDEAILNLNKAINLQPNFDQAHNNLGNILKNTGKFEEAVNCYREALKINPNYAEAYSNLGNALTEIGKIEEAIVNHQKALKLNPKYKIANVNESIARLTLGEFEIGWKKYEARIGENNITPMRYPIEKIWDGNYLNGILLVWAEQGLGDHIIFASMLADLKKYAKKIILQIDKRLENLLKRTFKIFESFKNVKLIVKLHPSQYIETEYIKKLINQLNPNITIYHTEPIQKILEDCDTVLNIHTEVLASTVLLEALIMEKPIMNISLVDENYNFQFIKDNAVLQVTDKSDLEKHFKTILYDEDLRKELIKNAQKHLQSYLSNQGKASKHFAEILKSL